MNLSPPTHRRAPWDAGGRLNGRQHGDPHPRVSGRDPESSLLRLPAARVLGSVAAAMTLLRRAPREVYRVYGEQEFFACAPGGEHVEATMPAIGVRRLHRVADATMVLAAMGAVGALLAIATRSAAGDGRRVGAGLLAATGSLGSSRGSRTHVWRGLANADADGPRKRSAPARPADRARQVELARQVDRARTSHRASARPRAGAVAKHHASAPIEPAPQASVSGMTAQASAESPQPGPPAQVRQPGQSEFGFER